MSVRNTHLAIILSLATLLVFWHINVHDVNEWDEARNGVNAVEMYQNGDYFNLYYGSQPDTWNAKPPLMIWMIVLCYKLFGFGEFALRLPAALCTVGFFFYFYKLISKIDNAKTALYSSLVLLSCKAVIGIHVGIAGDFDALLLLLLTASAYYFILFIDFDNGNAIYMVGLLTGLAFYTKGPAGIIYLPSFLLYAVYNRKLKWLFSNYKVWIALFTTISIVSSWLLLQHYYGLSTQTTHTYYGSSNSLEVLFWHDLVRRFTDMEFDHGKYVRNYFFFFTTMDSRMNLWNYLFYISIAAGGWALYKKQITQVCKSVVFSTLMILPLAIMMTIVPNQHDWYLAPVWGFVAYLTVKGILLISKHWFPFLYVAAAVLVFTVCRHFWYIHTLSTDLHYKMAANKTVLQSGKKIVYLGEPLQNVLLYLYWTGKETVRINRIEDYSNHKGAIAIFNTDSRNEITNKLIEPITTVNNIQIGMVK